MGWNYRRCRQVYHTTIDGVDIAEVFHSVHEVYAHDPKDDATIYGITEDGVSICGETSKELDDVLKMFLEAFDKPVIDMETIVYAPNTPNAETIAAMEDTENGTNLTRYDSVDEMISDVLGHDPNDVGC